MRFFDWGVGWRINKVIGLVVVVTLVVAYSAGYWLWLKSLDVSQLEQVAQRVGFNSNSNTVDLSKAENLFGTNRVAENRVRIVKESGLPIKLMASFVAGNKGRSAAVLDSGAGNQRLYFKGDKIMSGVELVELVEVNSNSVLIQRKGAIERLRLPQASNTQAANSVNSLESEGVVSKSVIEGGEELERKLEELRSLAVGKK